jgi:cysteinyl-tRNA synthetase
MARGILGQPIDIHGGGSDLIFPHHENEIAQSEGAFGVPLANYWMHNGFLNIDGEKMSKSLGNFFSLPEVLKLYDAQTVRFFMVRGHYRSEIGWSDKHLDDARAGLRRLYTALDSVPPASGGAIDWDDVYAARFKSAMDNDFGTPDAVAVLFDLAGEVNRSKSARHSGLLKSLGATLGILQGDARAFLRAGSAVDEATIQRLIEERAAAKKAKDFARADGIRKDLLAQGVVLKDSPAGTTWESAS